VFLEIVGQDLNGPFLLKADFRMPSNVVAHGEELGIHEFFRSRGDLIAGRIRAGELGNERL